MKRAATGPSTPLGTNGLNADPNRSRSGRAESRPRIPWPGLLAALFLASCASYRFVAPGSTLPEGVRSVSVPVFENATSEPGAEAPFTDAFRQGLQRAGRLGGDASEAVLEGKLLGVGSQTAIAAPNRLPTYRLAATLALKLTKNGRVLAQQTWTATEDFPSGADVLWSETNRQAALSRLAETMAHEGLEWLSSAKPPPDRP